eukprot:m.167492 g.167492  ORF g.167492 m.167492 type:complete len:513 (+) comp14461_c1_seq1:94-1632(+)
MAGMRDRLASVFSRKKFDPRYHTDMTVEEFCEVSDVPALVDYLKHNGAQSMVDVVKYIKELASNIAKIVDKGKFEDGVANYKRATAKKWSRSQSEASLQSGGPASGSSSPATPATPEPYVQAASPPEVNPYGQALTRPVNTPKLLLDGAPTSSETDESHYEVPIVPTRGSKSNGTGADDEAKPTPPARQSIISATSQTSLASGGAISNDLDYEDGGSYETLLEKDTEAVAPIAPFVDHDYDYIQLDRAEMQAPVPDVTPAPLSKNVREWTSIDVVRWLSSIGLSNLKSCFYHADISGTTLLSIQRSSLIKVATEEEIKKVLVAIEDLKRHGYIAPEQDADASTQQRIVTCKFAFARRSLSGEIKAFDKVKPLRFQDDTHVVVTSLDGSQELTVPEQAIEFIEPSTDSVQAWFHTNTGREQAEQWLVSEPSGTFLIRLSTKDPNVKTLCVSHNSIIYNFRILVTDTGLKLESSKDDMRFGSLQHLVAYYTFRHNHLPSMPELRLKFPFQAKVT